MRRLALFSLPWLILSAPALSADLDGPLYGQRDPALERPAPRIIERERIVEYHHHHYQPAPVYTEDRVYIEPRYYAPRRVYGEDGYDDWRRASRYSYAGWWRPRHGLPRGRSWHHHHPRGW